MIPPPVITEPETPEEPAPDKPTPGDPQPDTPDPDSPLTPTEPDTPKPDEPTPEEPKQSFRISWFSADGKELLQESVVEEGTLPAYTGPTPVLPADMGFATGIRNQYEPGSITKARLYNYTFAGWTPVLAEADGDAEYTANFAAGEMLEFPENYYEDGAFVYRVMDSVPYRRLVSGGSGIGGNVNALMRRIQIKAKMGYGPGYTQGEHEVWRNMVTREGMRTIEGYLIGRTKGTSGDEVYSSMFANGESVHIDGQLTLGDDIELYTSANYFFYPPDDPYADDAYKRQGIPFKATTPVIEGKVLGITEGYIPNSMDENAPQLVRTRRVSIDTNNDGREDECMTLSPLYVTHREMFAQIRAGDDIAFRIHQYSYKIREDKVVHGRVFPEDVESYGDYINDRDFIYKWATGNPAANGDNFQTIELVNEQSIGGVVLGDKYTGKASSLKH
jgi:hypothetical protein